LIINPEGTEVEERKAVGEEKRIKINPLSERKLPYQSFIISSDFAYRTSYINMWIDFRMNGLYHEVRTLGTRELSTRMEFGMKKNNDRSES